MAILVWIHCRHCQMYAYRYYVDVCYSFEQFINALHMATSQSTVIYCELVFKAVIKKIVLRLYVIADGCSYPFIVCCYISIMLIM